jgi:DNA-directed RNA polymerase sigma subunit (sigma70/sigma32)
MRSYLWPGDTGWPSPVREEEDAEQLDVIDLDADIDLDALSLHAPPPHLFDGLSELERSVLGARFGLGGQPVRSMKELHTDLGVSRHELRDALEAALDKLRDQLVR